MTTPNPRGGTTLMASDHSLGAFLRSRRERLDPRAPRPGTRRRTPGLRREEVAASAGVSVEWYTRLEQGRAGVPSIAVLEGLAQAMELTSAEREYLFVLADGRRPSEHSGPGSDVDRRLWRTLAGLPHSPAYVKTASWDIVAWNDAARCVLTDYPALAPRDRNVLRLLFTDPHARTLLVDWESEARLAVATFRRELVRSGRADDDVLVGQLCAASADFARMWATYDVGSLGEGVKRLRHPDVGDLAMWYSSSTLDDEPGLGLVIYTPATDDDAARIATLVTRNGDPVP